METNNLGTYPGFPMQMASGSPGTFNFQLDKIKSKLQGWQAKFLSAAGRTVLINSILSSIPIDVMRCTLIPQNTCQLTYRLNRSFLWGSSKNHRKLHLVNWRTITLPKNQGGLGIPRAEGKNLALLGNKPQKNSNGLGYGIQRPTLESNTSYGSFSN